MENVVHSHHGVVDGLKVTDVSYNPKHKAYKNFSFPFLSIVSLNNSRTFIIYNLHNFIF